MKKTEKDLIQENIEELKVIYTDVDGTFVNAGCLFRNRSGYSFRNAKAVFDLLSSHIDIVMTSGREKEKLKETARILGFKNYIANLGLEIVYNQGKKVVPNYGFAVNKPEELKEQIKESGVLEALFSRYPGKARLYSPWAEALRTHFLLIGELDSSEVENWIKSRYPELRIIDNGSVPAEPDFSAPHAYHIVPKNVGKMSAVRLDKAERNLKSGNLIGIGDSREDVSIAAEVGVFFLLDESVKTEFKNVIYMDNRDGEGFSRIIELLKGTGLI